MEPETEMEIEMEMEEEEEQKEEEEQEQGDEQEQEDEEQQEEEEEQKEEEEEEDDDEDSILTPSSEPTLFEGLKNFVKGVVPFVTHGDHVWEYCLTDKGRKHCGLNLSLDDLMRERDFLKHMKKFHDCSTKDMVLKQTNRIQIMIRHQETETSESTSDENLESVLVALKCLVLKSIWQAEESDSKYGPKDIFVCLQKNCGRVEFAKTSNLQRKMENHLRNKHPDETFQSLNIAFTYCGSTDTEEELLSLKCIKCGCQSYLKRIHHCSNHNWDELTENGLMCHLCENSIADQISNLKSSFDNWKANNPGFPEECSQCPNDLNETDHLTWVHKVVSIEPTELSHDTKYTCLVCNVDSIGMEQLKLHFATIEHASNMLFEK